MLGRTGPLSTIPPMRDGVIADFDSAEEVDQAFHPQGAAPVYLYQAQDHRLRAAWGDAGGKAGDPAVGDEGEAKRAGLIATHRGRHGGGDADHRTHRQHGGGYWRRHDRGGGAVLG